MIGPSNNHLRQAATLWLGWAALAWVLFYWPSRIVFHADEGYFLEMTARLGRGELPNADFATNYMGLFYWVNQAWFKLWGESFSAARNGFLTVTCLLYAPGVYWLARRAMNRSLAMLTTLAALGMLGLNYMFSGNWYAVFCAVPAIIAYLKSREPGTVKTQSLWLIVSGLAVGTSILMKHSLGLYTGLAIFYGLLLDGLSPKDTPTPPADASSGWESAVKSVVFAILWGAPMLGWMLLSAHPDWFNLLFLLGPLVLNTILLSRLIRACPAYPFATVPRRALLPGGTALVVIALYLTPYLVTGKLTPFLQAVFVEYPRLYLELAFVGYAQQLGGSPWFWLAPALLLAGGIRLWQDPQAMAQQFHGWFFWIWGALLFLNTYPLGTLDYVTYSTLPLLLLAGWLAGQAGFKTRPAGSLLLLLVACAGIRFAWQDSTPWHHPTLSYFDHPRARFYNWTDWTRDIQEDLAFIEENSQRKDDLFIFHDDPVLYFLSDHHNVTPYSYSIDAYFEPGKRITDALDAHRVEYVLVRPNRSHLWRQPVLHQYLEQYYQPYQALSSGTLTFRRGPDTD